MEKNLVLVPGAWLGARVWKKIIPPLEKQGYHVYPITLSGMGERKHLSSEKIGMETAVQDVVKIEKKNLRKKELDLISMVSPNATINIVENFVIKEKFNVSLPETVHDIIKCQNQNCVTNAKEPVKTVFTMERKGDKLLYRCHYCERTMTMDEIRNSITK